MSTMKAYWLDGRRELTAAAQMRKEFGLLDRRWMEVFPVLLAVVLAVLPNLDINITRSLGISREILLWPLLAVVLFVLFRYTRFTTLLSIIVLGIGVNLPHQLGLQLGVSPTMLQVALGLMVAAWLLNALFQFVPAQVSADMLKQVRIHESSAIMGAIYNGNIAEVDRLLKSGVSANVRNVKERTPLMLAVALGYQDIARLLMKYGADVTVRDAGGETALSIARRRDQVDMVNLLVALGALE
jgi:hypothetical protein